MKENKYIVTTPEGKSYSFFYKEEAQKFLNNSEYGSKIYKF